MNKAVAILKKGEGRALKAGGMWIYDNEIAHVEGEFADIFWRCMILTVIPWGRVISTAIPKSESG